MNGQISQSSFVFSPHGGESTVSPSGPVSFPLSTQSYDLPPVPHSSDDQYRLQPSSLPPDKQMPLPPPSPPDDLQPPGPPTSSRVPLPSLSSTGRNPAPSPPSQTSQGTTPTPLSHASPTSPPSAGGGGSGGNLQTSDASPAFENVPSITGPAPESILLNTLRRKCSPEGAPTNGTRTMFF